jgi:hypothetical protein
MEGLLEERGEEDAFWGTTSIVATAIFGYWPFAMVFFFLFRMFRWVIF